MESKNTEDRYDLYHGTESIDGNESNDEDGMVIFSPEQKREIQKFENLVSFSVICSQALKFKIRLPDFSNDDVFEMKKFLILKAFIGDVGKFVCLTPSDIIDAVWQEFMLNPIEYYIFCDGIIQSEENIRLIDYVPLNSNRHSKRKFTYTKQVYEEYFGYRPSGDIWSSRLYGPNSQSVSSGGGGVVKNVSQNSSQSSCSGGVVQDVVELQKSSPSSSPSTIREETIQSPTQVISTFIQRRKVGNSESKSDVEMSSIEPYAKAPKSKPLYGIVDESDSVQSKRSRVETEENERENKNNQDIPVRKKRGPGRPKRVDI